MKKPYTRKEVIRDSRLFLFLLSVVNLVIGIVNYFRVGIEDRLLMVYSSWCASFLFLMGAVLKYYWFRFILVCLWVVSLICDLFIQSPYGLSGIMKAEFIKWKLIYIGVGLFLIYLMWKFRNNVTNDKAA